MYRIASVSIDGFWDTHDIEFKLDSSVNFFIGQNGTGKTTLINLLAAALTADFRALDRISFRKLTVQLRKESPNEPASITVTKTKPKEKPFEIVEYRIRYGKGGSNEVKFSLEEIEEQFLLRRSPPDLRYRSDLYRRHSTSVVETLEQIVCVNWLSIHRSSSADRTREERSYESSVDLKLENLSNDLVRFFATLSRQKDDQVRLFQESMFLSLLQQEENPQALDQSVLDNIEKYKEALGTIFAALHVADDRAESLIRNFSERGARVRKKMRSKAANIQFEDIIFVSGLSRIDQIVARWNKLQESLKSVFAQRDKFVYIVNDLLNRKEMEITDSNELQFRSRSDKILTPQMLSSGEKQLLILLSETLLQKERTAIFIADEPELSLHVLWQEKLVSSLQALNPSAQIIVATHSPDIVGSRLAQAIDMETLIP